MIEILVYLFITSMLLLVISSLVTNSFNVKRRLKVSDLVQHDTRFILNFVSNRIHNVDNIEDANPALEQVLFYSSTSTRFSLTVESDNLVYRETHDLGEGFPEQSTADPIILNTNLTRISDLVLTPISDNYGNDNQGINLNLILTIGQPEDIYGYKQQNLNTFISVR